jgi:hypothetical protein
VYSRSSNCEAVELTADGCPPARHRSAVDAQSPDPNRVGGPGFQASERHALRASYRISLDTAASTFLISAASFTDPVRVDAEQLGPRPR